MSERGKYIVMEGSDGVGKTTQITKLKQRFEDEKIDVLFTNEPGGSPIGPFIRNILLSPDIPIESALTETILFSAERMELWDSVIEPALKDDRIVVSDRNWFSTLAYQTAKDPELDKTITTLTELILPPRYITPDLALILQLSEKERKRRRDEREAGQIADSFESRDEAFFGRVYDTYRSLPERMGATAILADKTADAVHEDIWERVKTLL